MEDIHFNNNYDDVANEVGIGYCSCRSRHRVHAQLRLPYSIHVSCRGQRNVDWHQVKLDPEISRLEISAKTTKRQLTARLHLWHNRLAERIEGTLTDPLLLRLPRYVPEGDAVEGSFLDLDSTTSFGWNARSCWLRSTKLSRFVSSWKLFTRQKPDDITLRPLRPNGAGVADADPDRPDQLLVYVYRERTSPEKLAFNMFHIIYSILANISVMKVNAVSLYTAWCDGNGFCLWKLVLKAFRRFLPTDMLEPDAEVLQLLGSTVKRHQTSFTNVLGTPVARPIARPLPVYPANNGYTRDIRPCASTPAFNYYPYDYVVWRDDEETINAAARPKVEPDLPSRPITPLLPPVPAERTNRRPVTPFFPSPSAVRLHHRNLADFGIDAERHGPYHC